MNAESATAKLITGVGMCIGQFIPLFSSYTIKGAMSNSFIILSTLITLWIIEWQMSKK